MLKLLSFLSLFFTLTFSHAWAATYYVDYTNGSDTNVGTSTSAAFKHSPGDDNTTRNSLGTILIGGDTVIFKGGVRYKGIIDIDWSGTTGKPITYDGNSAGTWGSGKAVIDNLNDELYAFYAAVARNYITIKNFEIVNIGGHTDDDPVYSLTCADPVTQPRGGAAINFGRGGSNITIQDSYIHEIGQWKNQPPFKDPHGITGTGIRLIDTSNVTIKAIELTRMHTGVRVGASTISSDIELINLDIHNYIVWGIDINTRAPNATLQNIDIHNSEIHDYTEYDAVNWLGCGEKPHTDGIFIRTSYNTITWNNINIYNNKFYNVTTSGGGTASVYLSRGPSAKIYNNTFINTLHGRTIFINYGTTTGSTPQIVRISNNSFYNNQTAINLKSEGSVPIGDIYIKNNIFYDTRSGFSTGAIHSNVAIHIEDEDSAPKELDYNHYYTFNTNKYTIRGDGLFGWKDLAYMQKNYSWEINGQEGDPKYKDLSYSLGTNSNLNDLHLQSSSPAKDAGVNLSTRYTTDKDGQSRPHGLGWDMGAYEYETVTPRPPTDLR